MTSLQLALTPFTTVLWAWPPISKGLFGKMIILQTFLACHFPRHRCLIQQQCSSFAKPQHPLSVPTLPLKRQAERKASMPTFTISTPAPGQATASSGFGKHCPCSPPTELPGAASCGCRGVGLRPAPCCLCLSYQCLASFVPCSKKG